MMSLLLWKLKKVVALVMFIAAAISLVAFFLNMGNIGYMFEGSGFNAFASGINALIAMLFMPLVLFTLGLIALFIPRPTSN